MSFGVLAGPALEPGSILAGKYRIERVIGHGGMGIVAAAYHIQLEQRVALKLMLPHAMASSEAVNRFLREARAAARISSEHIARVYDVGSLETGEPYIAMEYLEGADIAALLASRGRLTVDEAVEYLLQACEALAEAHAAGIVHRDLKPGNLFLVNRIDGQRLVKVLDFGISKVTGGSGAQSGAPMTRTSALMGSPLYMSPEQMTSSKQVDARSDIWALGIVFYEMLSGLPPFNGETLPQVCAMVMAEPPPPLAERAPGLPPTVYEVVRRCLEKQPDARFQSVAELARALEPIATPRARQSIERIMRILGVSASAVASLPQVSAPQQPGTHAAWGDTNPPVVAKRSPLPLALAGMALIVGGAGAWWALRAPAAPLDVSTAASGSSPALGSAPAVIPEAPVSAAVASPAPAAEPPSSLPAPSQTAVNQPAPAARQTQKPGRPAAASAAAGRAAAAGAAVASPAPAPAAPPAAPPKVVAPAAATPSPATPARSRL